MTKNGEEIQNHFQELENNLIFQSKVNELNPTLGIDRFVNY